MQLGQAWAARGALAAPSGATPGPQQCKAIDGRILALSGVGLESVSTEYLDEVGVARQEDFLKLSCEDIRGMFPNIRGGAHELRDEARRKRMAVGLLQENLRRHLGSTDQELDALGGEQASASTSSQGGKRRRLGPTSDNTFREDVE